MIKEVKIKRNVLVTNDHHERAYFSEEGIMIIEDENGKQYILDLESNADITNCDHLGIVTTEQTQEEVLFKNIMFDTEKIEKLANGGR